MRLNYFSKSLLILTVFFFLEKGYGQDKGDKVDQLTSNTKFGLALSGGGAKGLAYIGLLKKIDSLGIRIDYITGTSMGGVLGGLYAMGYSGKELEKMVLTVNWNRVLSNKVPLDQINIEEKDEYGNYLIEFPIQNGKPVLPSSLLEGQYLSEVLNTYTFLVRNIDDFSRLPISAQIMTSDILNGGLVIQKKGSLPLAIRATMAIPAVFSTVYIDGNVLVDGGLNRNFPVQEVRDMGADYVIGGYTGFRIFKEKEIQTPLKMIMQTYAFNGVKDYKEQMLKTDLLLDYTGLLNGFSSADFPRFKEILKEGEKEAQLYLPQLLRLAEKQRALGLTARPHEIPQTRLPVTRYNFLSDRNERISDPAELRMLHKLWQLKPGKYCEATELNQNIQRIYGTRFYEKVYYTFTPAEDGLEMNIHLKKSAKGHFKAAIHYDSDQGAGVVFNYTYYNLLLDRSRFLATVDVAERVKGRLSYYKLLTNNNKLWIKANSEYRNLKSNDFLLSLSSNSSINNPAPDFFTRNFNSAISLGYSFNSSVYTEAGLAFELESIYKPQNLFSKILGLNQHNTIYDHHNNALFVRIVQNSMILPYYSTKGNRFTAEVKYSFGHKMKLEQSDNAGLEEESTYNYLNPDGDSYDPKGAPGNVFRILVKDQFALPISSKISLQVSAMTGVNSSSKFGTSPSSYLYFNSYMGFGGNDERELPSGSNFTGLKQGELPLRSVSTLNLSLQYAVRKNLYLIPKFSYGALNDGYNIVGNFFKKEDSFTGYGAQLSYMSLLGPIDFVISKTNSGQGINFPWRAYFSFGYKF